MITYPPELEDFVQDELASGRHASEGELMLHALQVYRELKVRHDELRAAVEVAIAQSARGESTDWNADEFLARMRSKTPDREG
jgi:antitoxin ParD1/3/4